MEAYKIKQYYIKGYDKTGQAHRLVALMDGNYMWGPQASRYSDFSQIKQLYNDLVKNRFPNLTKDIVSVEIVKRIETTTLETVEISPIIKLSKDENNE